MSENYLGNINLKSAGVPVEWTPETFAEYSKCSQEPVYFSKNYVQIVNVDKGLMPFAMWPFQEEMMMNMVNNRFSIAKMPRQVGKTTVTAATILWHILFNSNYSVAILANKEAQAIEILSRIKDAYELLPMWMQQGVLSWGKRSITLENGSKIVCAATSSTAIRGRSMNLVYLDEFAFVPTNVQETFFASVYPTISSGTTTKVIITSTPNGFNLFYKG